MPGHGKPARSARSARGADAATVAPAPRSVPRGELLARVHALSVSVTLVWVTRRSARPPDKPLGAGAPCRVADVGCRVRGRVEQGLAAHAKRHAPRVLKSSHKRPLLHPCRGPQIAPKVLGDCLDTGAALGDPTLPTAGQSHRPRVSGGAAHGWAATRVPASTKWRGSCLILHDAAGLVRPGPGVPCVHVPPMRVRWTSLRWR